jgi:alkylation response protein AidB-like acyl-CoA dehydrogenase
MNFELKPLTEPGYRLVTLAEEHAADFATRAEQHDREGSFPVDNLQALQESGVLAACVPEELGGLGVDSIHDYVLGINRLGRGDSSTAIAANMHILPPWAITRGWKALGAAGLAEQAAAMEGQLRDIGARHMVVGAALSESGTDLAHPLVEAKPTEGGWLLSGRKYFGTMSAVADALAISCRLPATDGGMRWGQTVIACSAPGLEVMNNWDALGMRASGSHDVVLKDCFVPAEAMIDQGPWGEWSSPMLAVGIPITMGLVGAFLGIAEAARDQIVDLVKTRRKGSSGRTLAERPAIQHTIAEIEIDLAASRAMLARTALITDDFYRAHPAGSEPLDEQHELMKDFQCTKQFVTRKAVEIVDRALTASGGVGYLSRSPLSRLYRDVRAGPFMQPYSPNEAFEYIGKVTMGLNPNLDA